MMLRSASTPTLGSLLTAFPYQEILREVDRERESPICQCRPQRTVSFSPFLLSPGPQNFTLVDDAHSVDGGDWDFRGDIVPWPSFRRVQSENDLASLTRPSSLNGWHSSPLNEGHPDVGEANTMSNVQRQWSRRLALSRQSSLGVIDSVSSSSFDSERDDLDIETLESGNFGLIKQVETQDIVDVLDSDSGDLQRDQSDSEYEQDAWESESRYMNWDFCSLHVEPLRHEIKERKVSGNSVNFDGSSCTDTKGYEFAKMSTNDVASVSGRDDLGFLEHLNGVRHALTTGSGNDVKIISNSRSYNPVSRSELVGAMYIAGGLGIDGVGGGRGVLVGGSGGGSGHGDPFEADKHYRKALDAEPGHPLLLRNYAKFLYEVQRNVPKAEEFYERAILANPGDGEVLGQYAKLIWDVHRDVERAESYFERAIQSAPDDCYVVAAYASFLWNSETADDDAEDELWNSDLDNRSFHTNQTSSVYGSVTTTSTA